MIEIIRRYIEKDAISQQRELINDVYYQRLLNISHHIFFIFFSSVCFILLIITQVLAEKFPTKNYYILTIGFSSVGLLLLLCQQLKRHPRFLNFHATLLLKFKAWVIRVKYEDFFYFYFGLILISLYIPLLIFIIIAIVNFTSWISTSSNEYLSNVDSIKLVISLSGAIIAAQVVLFTFMFGQLLGKYSSRIAGAVNKHRVVLLLWFYPIISLLILFFSFHYGYPESIKDVLIPFLLSQNIICLLFTILIANTGIHADRAITYAGKHFSKKIGKFLKPAIHNIDQQPNKLWKFLGNLGLDFRDPERLKFYEPPNRGIVVTNLYLSSLFNAANKAIQENQQELLSANLAAILKLLSAYTNIRKSYYGSNDNVFSYTNDQMAALLKASARSPNEYMIVDVVRCIGYTGLLSLEISDQPKKINQKLDARELPQEHALSLSWLNLLSEGFDQSYSLMRSTAASESIFQLHKIALRAYQKEYYSVVTFGYIPNVEKIHKACMMRPDAYRRTLAGDCIKKSLNIIAYSSTKASRFGDEYDVSKMSIESIEKTTSEQFKIQKMPEITLNDVGSILTSKIQKDSVILQDIFYITLNRNFNERWEQDKTIIDIKQLIQLLVNLTKSSIEHKVRGQAHYLEALYEISYFILKGLPEQYQPIEDQRIKDLPEEMKKMYSRRIPSYQDVIEEELFTAWRELFQILFDAFEKNQYLGSEWQQDFWGILGIGMIAFQERKSEDLKNQIVSCTNQFRQLMITSNANSKRRIWNEWWDYLQLLGAWILHFIADESLAKNIANDVATMRPFSSGIRGITSRSHFGTYGYPLIHYSDFFLPWLRNLQSQNYLQESDWNVFRDWQKRVMNPEMLMSFYKIVEEIREPLREVHYKKIEQIKKKSKDK